MGESALQEQTSVVDVGAHAAARNGMRAAVSPATPSRMSAHTGSGLRDLRLSHRALPDRDFAEVTLATTLFGKRLAGPVLLEAGAAASVHVPPDSRPAAVAADLGLGLVVHGLEPPADARPPLVLAALPLTAVCAPDGSAAAERAVEALAADGVAIDLDILPAALRWGAAAPAGARATDAISAVVARLAPLPVLVRSAGCGMDAADARILARAGVAGLEVGSTAASARTADRSWADCPGAHAAAFADWGVPTADALVEARLAAPELSLLAGGGLRDGVDAAKCLALGADAVCLDVSAPNAALDEDATWIPAALHQLAVAIWAAGEITPAALTPGHLRVPLSLQACD